MESKSISTIVSDINTHLESIQSIKDPKKEEDKVSDLFKKLTEDLQLLQGFAKSLSKNSAEEEMKIFTTLRTLKECMEESSLEGTKPLITQINDVFAGIFSRAESPDLPMEVWEMIFAYAPEKEISLVSSVWREMDHDMYREFEKLFSEIAPTTFKKPARMEMEKDFSYAKRLMEALIKSESELPRAYLKNVHEMSPLQALYKFERVKEIMKEAENLCKFSEIVQSQYPYQFDNAPPFYFKIIDQAFWWLEELKKNAPYIPSLDLANKRLTSLPKEISLFSNLKSISLYNNKLETLPEEFSKLSQLTDLRLEKNSFKKFPNQIFNCTQLQSIYLSRNNIEKVPSEIGSLENLDTLVLTDNQIKFLPDEITNLSKLQVLSLNHNQLTTLPFELGNCKQIRVLAIKQNPFETLPPSIKNIWDRGGIVSLD